MKKKTRNGLIFLLVILIIIGGIVLLLFNNKQDVIREIDGVYFSLNNIKDEFLKSDYAKKNKCKVEVLETGLIINCNKKTYEYIFNGIELETYTDETGLELFKYVVNSIEVLHGASSEEYLDMLDEFIRGNISVNGLKYFITNKKIYLRVNVLEKLDLIKTDEIINNETVKNISEVNYEYSNGDYIIKEIDIKSDSSELIYVLSATFVGKDQNKSFRINYYDINNGLIKSTEVDLKDYNNYGSPYLNFVVTTYFSEIEFGNVSKYSISLS